MRGKTGNPTIEFKTKKNVRRWTEYSAAIGLMVRVSKNSDHDEISQEAYLHYNKTARQVSTQYEKGFTQTIKKKIKQIGRAHV